MIQSLRQVKRRIRSVENTKKITRAMQMVSGAKLKRSEQVLHSSRPYFISLAEILTNLLGSLHNPAHPLLQRRPENNIALVVVTSDTGLCSAYNDNIIRLAEEFIQRHGRDKVRLVTVGKKGSAYFGKRGLNAMRSYTGLQGRVSPEVCDGIGGWLMQLFLTKQVDAVYLVYTQFISALKYKPSVEKLLNIESKAQPAGDYLFEPGQDAILEELLPKYVLEKTRYALLNAFTSEHSARMIAMKAATDNSQELIDNLTLSRNKARQSLITKEIIEVSSAAETLKG